MIGKTVDWHVSAAISRTGGSRSGRKQQTIIHNLSLEKCNFISILLRESDDYQSSIHLYYSIMPIYTLESSTVV